MPYDETVRRIAETLKKNPEAAKDPAFIRQLERESQKGFDGSFRARTIPMAKLTREIACQLPNTSEATTRVAVDFPRPIRVVGFLASIVALTGAVGTVPTPDDIIVSIDADTEDQITASETSVAGALGGTTNKFVTLENMLARPERLVAWKVRSPRPNIGAIFRWRQFPAGGPAAFASCEIRLAVLASYLDED